VAALAYVLAFHRHGSFAGAIAALAVMILLELVATRVQHAEYVRIGVILQAAPGGSSDDDLAPFTGEAVGAENDALKGALADVYAHVPTVVRAYLVMRAAGDGSAQRLLALRYAYPWGDEDAVRVAFHVFQRAAPAGDTMNVIGLDDRSEARVRAIANPFYDRAKHAVIEENIANGHSPAP
jgi:SseB protein C-terminal domain